MGKTLRGTVLSENLKCASQTLEAALRVQVGTSPAERAGAELLLTIADALKFLVDSVPPDAASTHKKGSTDGSVLTEQTYHSGATQAILEGLVK